MTSQNTVLFIPAGPKILGGKHAYLAFLDSLDERIRHADASASIRRIGQV